MVREGNRLISSLYNCDIAPVIGPVNPISIISMLLGMVVMAEDPRGGMEGSEGVFHIKCHYLLCQTGGHQKLLSD